MKCIIDFIGIILGPFRGQIDKFYFMFWNRIIQNRALQCPPGAINEQHWYGVIYFHNVDFSMIVK